ncbi:recombination regulator RecX [Rhizobiaceae bacterium n13]|uniref:Regulatory protein RecX n=1 Tax=Ferirhizobium litorale TaxID=2927786 RepID=A0AAE3QG14_9HYPH|nr:recombination regulator RecX [Fererhizobium litorale]MDI7862775.1 recombination regulator RecX [Fererhizobium litorale]MDI7924361.1 recombination regulator RecX [Fererhizobium litorale]
MTEDSTNTDIPTPRMLAWARNSTIYRLDRQMMTERQLFDAISRKARQKFADISDMQLRAVADFAVRFAYDNKGLDDAAYAEISTRSGVRSGRSKRLIARKLSQKGVENSLVDEALQQADDLVAAVVFARKRGFGPFRRGELDEKRKAKELAAFARNGFGYEIGKKVFEMSPPEAEDALSTGLPG